MPVTDVSKDPDALKMTITARFPAPAERVWLLWSDPRQLERWWGPPGYPATFTAHELRPGGSSSYFMTSPEGEKFHGWWQVEEVESPHRLRFEDGFADAEGNRNDGMPTTTATVTLSEDGEGTTMAIESSFPSREAMEKLLEMGMDEGMAQALGQIDDLLREAA